MYIAYVLPEAFRAMLLEHYKPFFNDTVAHHITHQFGVKQDALLPGAANIIIPSNIITDHVRRVECITVAVNGEHFRPDGKRYHITWSLDRAQGAKPAHSNDTITAVARGETGGMQVQDIVWTAPMYIGGEGIEMKNGVSGPPIKAQLLR